MTFSKAEPKQAYIKAALYGPQGSGKTFTALLWAEGLAAHRGGRIAFVDTERGSDFYAMKRPSAAHPEAFDFDAIYTRSLSEVTKAIKGIDLNVHKVVVIDSISHLWESAIEAYEGKLTGADTIPMHAWGKIKRPYKRLIAALMAAPIDVIICGRQKNEFSGGGDAGELRKVGVAMRAEGETPYEPHICIRMESRKAAHDSTVSSYIALAEKDRTGVLAGRTIPNPTFKTILPILGLMGEEQAKGESEDARIEADSELLEQEDSRRKAKEEVSKGFLHDFNTAIIGCSNLEELAEVSKVMASKKRKITDGDKAVLREVYLQRRETLVAEVAKSSL